jgi:hypothetical protein
VTIDAPGTSDSVEATLTRRQLNRALLARQLLLDRATLPLPEVLERMAGLQAQYAPSMYIGLWSRAEGFERHQLTRALEDRQVVQGTLLRSTIHLVSARDYWDHACATRQARQVAWLRSSKDLSAEGMAAAADTLRAALADGPLRRTEVEALIGKRPAAAVGAWLDIVRVPPSGTWERRRADLYGLADHWLAGGPGGGGAGVAERADGAGRTAGADGAAAASELPSSAVKPSPEEALARLVRAYLGGFGPATAREIANWAGVLVGQVTPLLDGLGLRRFRAEDGQQLLDLPDAPLPDPGTPAPVRFLPTWDATLLVHARRKEILSEEHRPLIFNTKMPQSVPTFLVDGTVAGTWRHDEGHIRIEPFAPLDPATRREVEEEADRLAALHA